MEGPSRQRFGVTVVAQSGATQRLRASLLHGHEITTLPDPEPLIEDLLPLDSVAVLWGPPGSGKSLLALDWALHIASGREWAGRPTRSGQVLYVVAEGARGTKQRYESWCEHHGVSEVEAITWMTAPANILVPEERGTLLSIVAEVQPIFTVLDTVARHIPGADENSSETMSLVVDTLDDIKRVTIGTALGVHHSGKDLTAGGRGHSSLKGGLDAELSVRTSRSEGRMTCIVYAEKFKDWEDHRVLYEARMDHVGESLVPIILDPLTKHERQALACLNGVAVSTTEWQRLSCLSRATFYRAKQRLTDLGFVVPAPTGWAKSQVSPL